MSLGYKAGDAVYVFARYGFHKSTVKKVTPTGRVVVEGPNGTTMTFNATGRLIASERWAYTYIAAANEQEGRAQAMREQRARDQRDTLKRRLKAVFDGWSDKAQAISVARELLDELEPPK